MSYRNLRFLEYGMTNAIHYKCEFACDSKPKRGNTKLLTYIRWRILGRGDHKT